MRTAEAIAFWAATVAYAVSFAFALFAGVLKKDRLRAWAFAIYGAAVAVHVVSFVARWLHGGRAPIVSAPEAMSMTVLLLGGLYIGLVIAQPRLRVLGPPVAAAALLLMGWSRAPQQVPEPLSPALDTIWLVIHASFATLAAGCFLVSSGASIVWLRAQNGYTPRDGLAALVPRLNFLGFIMWGVMIASGAIWANLAWGRYWGWDPIEIWSLLAWLLYALLMHLTFTVRLSMRKVAWFSIIATLTVIFALWGVGYLYETIHTYG